MSTMSPMSTIRFCPQCSQPLQTVALEGRSHLQCRAAECGYIHWDNPIPVVAAIVEHEGLIILARSQGWPEKQYGLITGFLERGETPEQAVRRELGEELGLEAVAVNWVGHYSFFEMNQLLLVYHIIARGEIVLSDELAGIKSLPIERLKPWAIGTGPAVRDWLARRCAVAPPAGA